MSAIRGNKVKLWIVDEEPSNVYWSIVRKVKSIEFVETTKERGIELEQVDKSGRLNTIYLGELNDNYVNDYGVDHKGLYEVNGEFETKDMCLVKISKPEVVTLDYIRDSGTLLSELVKRVLLERIWNR